MVLWGLRHAGYTDAAVVACCDTDVERARMSNRVRLRVDQRIAIQMVRLDLALRWMREHHDFPFVRGEHAPLRRAPGEQPVALRVE